VPAVAVQPRDRLAAAYAAPARRALLAAIAAESKTSSGYVASPGRELRNPDRGGRTAHERAFTRAAYYEVIQVPRRTKTPRRWSLQLEWGPVEKRGDKYGRTVRLRLFRYGSRAYQAALSRGAYTSDPSLRSAIGNRIDQ
jgi:hypothetical protein